MRVRACLVLLISMLPPTSAWAGIADRNSIHDIQKAYWDSITTMEMTGEEFVLDSSLKRREGPKISHNDFRIIYGSNGRMSFRRVSRGGDGSHKGNRQFREDGRAKYGITSFPDDPDAIDDVVLMNQTSRHGRYEGEMCIAFWAWMPGGKPIHLWLEEGAALTTERDSDGRDTVILTSPYRQRTIRIELDPEHDWLPKRVELIGYNDYRTREFARDNGHWFPSNVIMVIEKSAVEAGVNTRSGFMLGKLAVNRSVPANSFGMPEIPDGALVRDQRKLKSNYFKGGILARKKLEEAHEASVSPIPSPHAAQAASDVVATPEPSRFPWQAILVMLSGIALFLAWRLRRGP